MESEELKQQFLDLLAGAELVTERSVQEDSDQDDQSSNKSKTEKGVNGLLPLVSNAPLFVSIDDGSSFIHRKGRLLQLDTKNRELCEDLRLEGFDDCGQAPSKDTVATVVELLSARARRDGKPIELFNRVGESDGKFFYYLGGGRAVMITPGAWFEMEAPVMFRMFKHQKVQVSPHSYEGDPWRILDFLLLKEEQKLLFLVTLITCFIPRISHPAVHVSGSQGAGKSFGTRLIKAIVDPSSVALSMMPRKPEDLDLLLFRHKCLALDNLSALNFDTCDRLCSMISGGSIEKRTLHTDLETTVLQSNPVILYSSIGSLHSRPDLAERTIVIELQRIPDSQRKEESELLENFQNALPTILGGIFDVLAQAVSSYDQYPVSGLPRMAEFARWGYVIAEELGESGAQFLADYAGNSSIQTSELIERDTFFAAIVETMHQPARESLSGSFSEVLLTLIEVAAPGEAKNGYSSLTKDKTFPGARGFRKHLERIRIPLENMQIAFSIDNRRTSQAKAFVTFTKIVDPGNPEGEKDQN